ncbi:peptidyl-prolyl cis-trans isomerase [Propionibacterium freudenreichii]|nr:peptidyl-prolyl cis-trans isomerase [Propionibacterium freudenreichii]
MSMTDHSDHAASASASRHRWTRWASLALVPILLLAAGCSKSDASASPSSASAPASQSATSTASASSSGKLLTSLDSVQVSGGYGQEATVTADWPVQVNETMSKVLVQGNGQAVGSTSYVEVNYVGVDARTGQTFDNSYTKGATATFGLSQVVPGFQKGLDGKHIGDRVLIGVTGKDGYDAMGGASAAGIEVGDTLFFVVDLVSTQLNQPSGEAVTPAAGLPTVSGDINNPSITIPSGVAAPSDLVVQPLIKGTGKQVAATDTVTVNFISMSWGDSRVVQSTYSNGSNSPQTGALSGVVEGWQKGLVGQPVGSRVLLVVPPSQAYPDGNTNPSIAPNTTMVYVVDILFTRATTAS